MITTAVIGHPLAHSLSPLLHNTLYELCGIDARMIADDEADIALAVSRMRDVPYALCAITAPHKESVMPHLDEVDETAIRVGAVNTVLNRNGILRGYNTDIAGIRAALSGVCEPAMRVLVVGAGGAARAACYALQKMGAQCMIVNRSPARAEALARECEARSVKWGDVAPREIDGIVNATSVGQAPRVDESPVPAGIVLPHHFVFDVVYNPRETLLLAEARRVGARAVSGAAMFVAQAAEQVRILLGGEFPITGEEIASLQEKIYISV